MKSIKKVKIQSQPNDFTCGPTCLHAIYEFYEGEGKVSLEQIIKEVEYLETGGTLAVLLATHALKRGYEVKMNVLDLNIFDPTWFIKNSYHLNNSANSDGLTIHKSQKNINLREHLIHKLEAQIACKEKKKVRLVSKAYVNFLKLGGEVMSKDISSRFLKSAFESCGPVLTGLSATYLYRCSREIAGPHEKSLFDDVRGEPTGHFVVLNGYTDNAKSVLVADPFSANPLSERYYSVRVSRLINAILLGEITYDANLVFIRPKNK